MFVQNYLWNKLKRNMLQQMCMYTCPKYILFLVFLLQPFLFLFFLFFILMRASVYADQLFLLDSRPQHKKIDLQDRKQIDFCAALNSSSCIAKHQHCPCTQGGYRFCPHMRKSCAGDLIWQQEPDIRR